MTEQVKTTNIAEQEFDLFFYDELSRLRELIKLSANQDQDIKNTLNETGMADSKLELEEVINNMLHTTNSLMDCAEEIEKLAKSNDVNNFTKIIELSTKIFELCSFQDISGQRINKVIKTIISVEESIDSILKNFSSDIANKKEANWKKHDTREDKDLLNGPQKSDQASSQDKVDDIFK